jgi:uncharacterized protein YjdB
MNNVSVWRPSRHRSVVAFAILFCGGPALALAGAGCGRDSLHQTPPDGAASQLPDGGTGDRQPATIVSIAVDPPAATLVRGSSRTLAVTALFDDGTRGDVTSSALWSTDDAAVATVTAGVVTAVAPGSATVTATVGSHTGSAAITVTTATVTAIAVLPATATTAAGTTLPFTADATLSDGSHQDLTTSAAWTSSAPNVATVVSTTGVATAVGAGTATITAAFAGTSGTARLTVSGATLVSIQIDPLDPVVGVNVAIVFTATGIYSDGTRADLTRTVTWSSSAAGVVTIDATGRAMTRARGTSVVTASLAAAAGATSASSTVTVTAATLDSITVSPPSATLMVGGTAILRAIGHYSDGSSADLTTTVIWTATPAAIASVSNAGATGGTVTALAAGTATIAATSGTVSGTAVITVSVARLVAINVNPAAASIPAGSALPFTAQGIFADGSIRDVTTQVAWQSSTDTVATVSNLAGQSGSVTGVSAGTATISATLTGVTGTATVTVVGVTLRSIAVTPANATTTVTLRSSYTAIGTYSDGTTVDLTAQATWSTGAAAVAAISNTAGAQGQLLARAPGTTSVTAAFGTVTGSTNVTVIARAPSTLSIAPIATTTRLGTVVRYTATEIFTDGTQQNVTNQATWASSARTVATISNRGVATPVAVGTTTITVTFMGLTATTTLTVTSAVIASIQVTPVTPLVPVGTTVAFTAQAIFSDGTLQNVTANATWTSSAPGVLAVTTAGANRGRGTGIAAGGATVTATFMGISGSTDVTVTSAVIVQISVSPAGLILPVGLSRQFTAQAIFSDGTSQDVTARATWISDKPAVAAISDAAATRGLLTAVAAGTANIQASFGGLAGTVGLTVSAATLTTIQVTPFNQIVPVGTPLQFQATGLFSDGTSLDLTAAVTWVSSDGTVVAVSNAAGTRGQATALGAGKVQIAASTAAASGSTSVTVTNALLVSIAISPANSSLAAGKTAPFTALGTFDDGTILDVTAFVTWTSSNVAAADVSNANGSRGQVTAFAGGNTTIQAQRGPIIATTGLTVN